MDSLAQKNMHIRDSNITFEAGPHLYTIKDNDDNDNDNDNGNGDNKDKKKYISVTTWNHSHFGHFDADLIITQMMKGKNWPKSPYFGKTREEIKAGWEVNRNEAATLGTQMHYQIEYYYNMGKDLLSEQSIEYTYFKNFLAACPDLKPYRTEWMVYHEELRLAGSIDMVYENPDGSLMIYDWKRAKDIKKADAYAKYAQTECISHIPDTNFWHYALQLNTYKTILEQKYGKTVTKLALVCLHPTKKNFEVIPIPILIDEMAALSILRKALY